MKAPKYAITTMQDAINVGINAFAFQMLAESMGDVPEKLGDANLLLSFEDHNHNRIWFVMTKTKPVAEDFEP